MDSFAAYQNSIRPTAIYADVNNGARSRAAHITFAALDLCIHAGAVADKVKKVVRDDDGTITEEKREFITRRSSDARDAAKTLTGERIGSPAPRIEPGNEVTANKLSYLALGLCGESAEVAEKIAAALSTDGGTLTEDQRAGILKEAGDTLWYLTRLVDELKSNIGSVALDNLHKVRDRRERGVSQGSGDDR